jgi:hypothetical protein
MLGESYNELVNYFGSVPAVFEVDEERNRDAYDKAMNSLFVRESGETYDVLVYGCDGAEPYCRGNVFSYEGVSYLAMSGKVNMLDYDLKSMRVFKDVIGESL